MPQAYESISCFGELLWDLLPQGKQPGGAPANVATHLRQLGCPAYVVSSIGRDTLGDELATHLKRIGQPLDFVQRHATAPTGYVTVDLSDPAAARYDITRGVAWDHIAPDPVLETLLPRGILVYGSLAARSPVTRSTLERYLERAAYRILDINLRPPHYTPDSLPSLLHAADTLKLNEEELPQLLPADRRSAATADQLAWLRATYGLQRCLLTMGAEGAYGLDDSGFYRHPGYPVQVVDTVGSGDAFLAGFLASRLAGAATEAALRFASATGAYVAAHGGATPTLDQDRIDAFAANKEE